MSRPLTWLLVEAGALSHGEPRKSQTQGPLPTRPTDACGFDNPTAGGSFFSTSAVTPLTQTPFLTRDRRPDLLRQPVICPSARCPSPCSTLGGETTAPPFSTSPSSFRLLPCGDGSDTPFSAAVLAGTAGWRHLLTAPWRRGAPLLSRHAGPSGFPVPPKKIGHHFALAAQRIFFSVT